MKNNQKNSQNIKSIVKALLPYVLIIVGVFLVKLWIVTPVVVNGTSMYPTLHHQDVMILNRTAYWFNAIKRFDIVVIKTEDELIIKRVIGLPGEHVVYQNNKLYINGKRVQENVKNLKTDDFDSETLGQKKIPKDAYLVLGDNRNNSQDSRSIGFIKKSEILGKTSLVIFPLNRIGFEE